MTLPPTDPVLEAPAAPPDPLHELRDIYQRSNLTWLTPDAAPQYEAWIDLLARLYAAGAPAITAPVVYHDTTRRGRVLTPDDWTALHHPTAPTAAHQALFVPRLCIELPADLLRRTDVLVEVARSGPQVLTLSADRRYLTLSWA